MQCKIKTVTTTKYVSDNGFVFMFQPINDEVDIKEIEHVKRGHQVKYEVRYVVHEQESDDSPRDWDNLGRMICFHRSYKLGDEHKWDADEFAEYVAKSEEVAVALPLYLYDHSGISMSTGNAVYPYNCPWDSGMVGCIMVSKVDVMEKYNVKKISKQLLEKVAVVLKGEVETYNEFLTGDVMVVLLNALIRIKST